MERDLRKMRIGQGESVIKKGTGIRLLISMGIVLLLCMSSKTMGEKWIVFVGKRAEKAFLPGMFYGRADGLILEMVPIYYVDECFIRRNEEPEGGKAGSFEEEMIWIENLPGADDTLELEKHFSKERAHGEQVPMEQLQKTEAAMESQLEEKILQNLKEAKEYAMLLENERAIETKDFIPHTKIQEMDLVAFKDLDTLVRNFYIIDKNTMADEKLLDVESFMKKDFHVDKGTEDAQILIYHTHSQEAFADSAPGEEADTVVGVGEKLAQILTQNYGYKVLHHTGKYDVASRDKAYSEALPAIEQILQENPSIKVVIDLHRDAVPDEQRLVMNLDGRPTARFMFFNGLSQTKKTGKITYLRNDHLKENLAFSFRMQKAAQEYYPGLSRKIYLKGYRYNMHLCPMSLLIELGAQNNTVEEAMNACDPLAHILDLVIGENF